MVERQEFGRRNFRGRRSFLGRRSFTARSNLTGSGTLTGRGRKLVVLLVLGGLFFYLVLPLVVESLLAARLQTALSTPTKPDVEVSSNFPPELLLGHIDRIQVRMDQATLQGVPLYNARADLRGVKVPVSSLITGNPVIETQSCSVRVDTPPVLITQNAVCLSYLGLGAIY